LRIPGALEKLRVYLGIVLFFLGPSLLLKSRDVNDVYFFQFLSYPDIHVNKILIGNKRELVRFLRGNVEGVNRWLIIFVRGSWCWNISKFFA